MPDAPSGLRTFLGRLAAVPPTALRRLIGLFTHRIVQLDQPAGALTLIADSCNHRVIEIDGTNAIGWQYGTTGVSGRNDNQLNTPRDAKRLSNGNTLIADAGNDRVIEIARDGTVVWSYANLRGPRSASRLANGHTVISDRDNHRVIEVNLAGTVQWSYGTGTEGNGPNQLRWPRHAERLANGNTLITDDFYRVIEVTPAGAIAWQHTVGSTINAATRLENGNTLLAIDGNFFSLGVLELTPGRDIDWWYSSGITSDAKRLPNGNTLLSIPSNAHVIEVDPNRNIVWQYGTTDQPGSDENQVRDPWEATRLIAAGTGRPDLAARWLDPAGAPGTDVYTGLGVYGSDGANQTVGPPHLGGSANFAFRLVNTGTGQASFNVTASVLETPTGITRLTDGWTARFFDALGAGTDITAAIMGTGWATQALAPGAALEFRLEVKNLNRGSSERFNTTVTARSSSDATVLDVVRTVNQAPHIA